VAAFVLRVRDLPEGVSEHALEILESWLREQLADLEGTEVGPGPGSLRLEVTRQGTQVLVRGAAEVSLVLTCVRCLGTFLTRIRASLDVLMRPGSAPRPARGEELGLEDLGEEVYQGEEIVLDDLLRDFLLLEVPMNPSCGEACPGWAARAGRE
jgi:uncharacterized metal-binding protein YceD (DUF177 family)